MSGLVGWLGLVGVVATPPCQLPTTTSDKPLHAHTLRHNHTHKCKTTTITGFFHSSSNHCHFFACILDVVFFLIANATTLLKSAVIAVNVVVSVVVVDFYVFPLPLPTLSVHSSA